MRHTFLLIVIFLLIIGCTPSNQTVSRISVDEVTDISGNWNDTDSKLVAEQMVRDLMYRVWISDFQMEYAQKPTLIVGTIRNKSSEHIQTDTFVKEGPRVVQPDDKNINGISTVENSMQIITLFIKLLFLIFSIYNHK